jgi:ribosomal protein S18 acetylase RimI-like enzyme
MRVDKPHSQAFDFAMPSVRSARESDRDALLDLMEDFNRDERIEMRREITSPALARLIADASLGRVLVIEEEGLAGYAVLTWGFDLEFGGRDSFLTELFVAPEKRRRGLGRLLLDAVAEAARDGGAGAIHLGVYPDNQRALALYRSAGYTRLPRDFYSKRL